MKPDVNLPGTVVVGCDGSWHSRQAVRVAAREALRRGTGLVLLSVAEPLSAGPDQLPRLVRAADDAMSDAMAVAEQALTLVVDIDPTLPTQVVIAPELAAPEAAAAAAGAGLLVLGRHGVHGQLAFSIGSTSAELARLFSCPVMVATDAPTQPLPQDAEPSLVLVGLDAGRDCARIFTVAAQEAAARGSRLVAVHALAPGTGRARADLAAGWRRVHEAMRSVTLPEGVPSRLVITRDDPVTALLLRARAGDLLVVGTKAGGRLAGLVAGSVSRGVLDSMPCDVLVVTPPRPGSGDDRGLALAGQEPAQRP